MATGLRFTARRRRQLASAATITNTGWEPGSTSGPNPGIGFPRLRRLLSGHPGGPRNAERPLSRRARTRTDSLPAPRRTEPAALRPDGTPLWLTFHPPAARRSGRTRTTAAGLRNRSWCRCRSAATDTRTAVARCRGTRAMTRPA